MTRNRPITLALLATVFTLFPLAAHAATSMFNAHLSGREVSPARLTNAEGEAKFVLNPDGTQLGFRVNVSNIENVVAAEVRLGAPGSDGAVVATLYGPVPAGGGKKTGTLAQGTIAASSLSGPLAGQPLSALITQMQSQNVYVIIRTDSGTNPFDLKPGNFPNGEIRGQVKWSRELSSRDHSLIGVVTADAGPGGRDAAGVAHFAYPTRAKVWGSGRVTADEPGLLPVGRCVSCL